MAIHFNIPGWRIPWQEGPGRPQSMGWQGVGHNGNMDLGPPGSSAHGVLQARTLEWGAIFSSGGSPGPRDRTHVSWVSSIASRFFTI